MSVRHNSLEPTCNRLLALLPADDCQRLLADLERVEFRAAQVLWAQGEPVRYVLFLVGGLCSDVVIMADGRATEASMVGNEGMLGLPVFFGAELSPSESICQVPAVALRMPADVFRRHLAEREPLRELLLRYTQALLVQTQRNAACNRLHSVDSRLARWLLMAQDRVGAEDLPLTQEFLGMMLGVRRATVSAGSETLQAQRLIRYRRGSVAIVDRPGLEAAACEDYRAIQAEYARLLG